jgi:hypothetical protein
MKNSREIIKAIVSRKEYSSHMSVFKHFLDDTKHYREENNGFPLGIDFIA